MLQQIADIIVERVENSKYYLLWLELGLLYNNVCVKFNVNLN